MMKRVLLIIVISVLCVTYFSVGAFAAGKTYRLKQWIAPLECTQNEIVDGVTTQTYLTPKECKELLDMQNEKPPKNDDTPTPGAPDTGYADSILGALFIITTVLFVTLLRLVYKRRVL